MVELVTDGAREKALRGKRLLLAVAVEIGELYLHGTGNHAALAAHEQRIAKLLLEQLDLLADGRLRDALLLGGTGEIEVLCSR